MDGTRGKRPVGLCIAAVVVSRRVVVTGGSRGIGAAIVRRFVALGEEVIAVGRDASALDAVAGSASTEAGLRPGSVTGVLCDLTDEPAVVALMRNLERVDVLVNNAGISDSSPLHRTTLASWEAQMAVNATAVFLCIREVIEGMRERNEGRIVTVASIAGRAGVAYAGAYSASKHAAIGITRSAAAELAGTRVTANAVCPAFVDSEMTHASVQRIVQRTGRSVAESTEALSHLSPLGRLLDPDEVAATVTWLASPDAGAINGQTIVIDGGGIQA